MAPLLAVPVLSVVRGVCAAHVGRGRDRDGADGVSASGSGALVRRRGRGPELSRADLPPCAAPLHFPHLQMRLQEIAREETKRLPWWQLGLVASAATPHARQQPPQMNFVTFLKIVGPECLPSAVLDFRDAWDGIALLLTADAFDMPP